MKHKIYIDNNDEITTIVEKLRIAQAVDILMVVSQNSLLLQSVINLRLLEREAMKCRKKITIATHDEEGATLAEKVGILVDRNYSEYAENKKRFDQKAQQDHLVSDDIQTQDLSQMKGTQQVLVTDQQEQEKDTLKSVAVRGAVQEKKIMPTMDGMVVQSSQKVREASVAQPVEQMPIEEVETAWSSSDTDNVQNSQLQENPVNTSPDSKFEANLGTDQFFSFSQKRNASEVVIKNERDYERNLINSDLVTGASIDIETKEGQGTKKKKWNATAAIVTVQQPQKTTAQVPKNLSSAENSTQKPWQQKKEELISDFYQQEQRTPIKKKKEKLSHTSHGIFSHLTKIVAVLAIILAIATSLFIFLPKTDMHIILKRTTEMADLTIDAVTSANTVDIERRIIPGTMIAINVTRTASFPSTQEITSSQQKAHGQVTLYNEFGADEQQLVATTRLESSDGRIFRLVKGVRVPGVKDGKPGQIKVSVVADSAGSEYDIGPDNFTIPGLSDSQKFRKIYGKSDEAMRGGGSGGKTLLTVSEEDLAAAEKSMKETFAEDIRIQIVSVVEENGGGIFLEDTVDIGDVIGNASVTVETAVDRFDYTLTAPVKVISFSGDDVYTILDAAIIKKIDNDAMALEGEIMIVYGDADTKYEKEELSLDVKGEGSYVASVDEEAFRRDVLGKTIEEITTSIHEKYVSIDRIDFNFAPNISFLTNKLSSIDKMLSITFE